MKNKWSNKKVVLVIHEATTGPGHDLRDYLLKNKVGELLFISHPLLYIKSNKLKTSYYLYYKNGNLFKKHNAKQYKLPEYVLYIKDIIYSIFWSYYLLKKPDLYVGYGNLNACAGLILRRFSVVKKVVYYVIDYVPNRFSNKLINNVYHTIEKICAESADSSWNLSPRMIEAREKKWNKKFPNQHVVPHGVHIDRIKHVPFNKVNKTEILYMGTLLEKQGIQLVLQSIKILAKKVTSVSFTIIGHGPYESELKRLTRELKIEKYVHFLGYVESHEEMEDRIAQAGITVALYDKKVDEFSYYADPGKIKNYLGAGVPVIMTDVPYIARQIVKEKCGFIINYDKNELIETLQNYFTNDTKMRQYRINALKFAKLYEWNTVFDKALKQSQI